MILLFVQLYEANDAYKRNEQSAVFHGEKNMEYPPYIQ